jgi:CSLREA domain-containing protein
VILSAFGGTSARLVRRERPGVRRDVAASLAVMLALVATMLQSAGVDAGSQPQLRIVGPAHVSVGQSIRLKLSVVRASDVGGYEATALFDEAAAHLAGVFHQGNTVQKSGRGIVSLGPVSRDRSVSFGFYSCPVRDCATTAGVRRAHGPSGRVSLGTLQLVPDRSGTLQIGFAGVRLVTASGRSVPVAAPAGIAIRVGNGGKTANVPAASFRFGAPVVRASSAPAARDITGDRRISNADVQEAVLDWTLARTTTGPCLSAGARTDLNADGCIDVADVQAFAAAYSRGRPPQVPGAGSGHTPNGPGPVGPSLAPAAVTFTVNTTSDDADAAPGDGVCQTAASVCSLRAAIEESNRHTGADGIAFNIPGSGVHTINLASALPTITDETGPLEIDGYTQPGSSPNTDALASNAVINIAIVGGGDGVVTAEQYHALRVTSANNTIRGLAIYSAWRKIWLTGPGATNNLVAGSYIGTDPAATFVSPTFVATADGAVLIDATAHGNRIGEETLAGRNVIGGNQRSGVHIYGENAAGNVIHNNIIGLSPDGTRRLANFTHGADIDQGARQNILGGLGTLERNVIGGSGGDGVEIVHTPNTFANQVIGNYFGTELTGTRGPSYARNRQHGIHVDDGARNTVVTDNLVVGNGSTTVPDGGGIVVEGKLTTGTVVARNRVGVTLDGTAVPNIGAGIAVRFHALGNTIGPGNIVTNQINGIEIGPEADVDRNTITQNAVWGNTGLGIEVLPAGVNPNGQYQVTGPNEAAQFPELTSATPSGVSGRACASCTVEVFLSDAGADQFGDGRAYAGTATAAADGSFTAAVSGLALGDYVTATATDANGNTSEFALNRLVRAGGVTPAGTVFARDTFTRDVTDQWGTANLGGPYTLTSTLAEYDVAGGRGTIALTAGANRHLRLASLSEQDIDFTVQIATDKLSEGADQNVYLALRRHDNGNEYRARVRLALNGGVYVQATRVVGGTESAIGTEVRLDTLVRTAGQLFWVRAQGAGASPTTLRIKVWADGTAEPSTWLYTQTNSEASLQSAGAIGLRAFAPTATTNAPVTVSFDELTASVAQSDSPPPNGAPTVSLGGPADGATGTSTSPSLSATGTDPEGTSLAVTFFGRVANSGVFAAIASDPSVPSGSPKAAVWSGLESGLRYEWYVTVSDGVSTATSGLRTFNTTPGTDPVLVGAGDIASCAVLGDEATAAVVSGIAGGIFTLGDNAYPDGTAADFASCYDPSWGGALKARTRPTPGNHDWNTGNLNGYFGYFGAAAGGSVSYYSYDVGANWHVVVLDSNCTRVVGGCAAGSAQMQWLTSDLAASASRNVIAMWHHPRFSSGGWSAVDTQPFVDALYAAHADLVLVGHDHMYERFAPMNASGAADPNGLRFFTVGTGGESHQTLGAIQPNSEVRNASTYGVMKLTLHPTGYDWEFFPVAGQTFTDSGSATITNTNRAPVFSTDLANANAAEGDPVSFDADASDLDGDPLTYSASGLPGGLSIDPGTGLISGTLSFASAGVHTVTVTVSDGSLTDTDDFTLTVSNTNRAPVFSTDIVNQSGAEGNSVSLDPDASDPDGDSLTYSATGLPAGLSIDPGTGLISGTLAFGSAGGYTVDVTVTDGSLTDSDGFTFTVSDTNREPAFNQDLGPRTDAEGAVISLSAGASDPDGDPLTYEASGLPAGLSINAGTGLISGTISFAAAGSSPYAVTITVRDGPTVDATDTFTWNVTNTNRPPTFSTDFGNRSDAEGAAVSMDANASDPDGDTLTYSATGLPGGTGIDSSTGVISGTLSGTSSGTYSVAIIVTDGALTATDTFTWTVTEPNSAPSATVSISPSSPTTDQTLTATATASDPDGNTVSLHYVWKVNGTARRTVDTTALSDTFDLSVAGNGDPSDSVSVEVTPSDGALSGATVSSSVTVAASSLTVYANDLFNRTVLNSWGSAGTGGAYTLQSTAANYDVNGGVGTIAVAAGGNRSAVLTGASALDVELSFRVATDKVGVGGSQFVYGVLRRVSSTTEYRIKLRLPPNGNVLLQASSVSGNVETAIGSEVLVAGLNHTPGGFIRVRAQISGSSPTTIRIRAWADGTTEPSTWQYSASNSAAGLQVAGAVGLRAYLASATTNGPVLFSFDDLRATSLGGP